MKELQQLIEEDLRREPPADRLERVREVAREARDWQVMINGLEERLEQARSELRKLVNNELPALFEEFGILTFTLSAEGNLPEVEAKLDTVYNASIPEDRKAQAIEWLEKEGHGDLVKTEIKVLFGMGQRERAKHLEETLRDMDLDYDSKISVHHMTLKSFVKNQIGTLKKILPQDILGLSIFNIVKLTFKK